MYNYLHPLLKTTKFTIFLNLKVCLCNIGLICDMFDYLFHSYTYLTDNGLPRSRTVSYGLSRDRCLHISVSYFIEIKRNFTQPVNYLIRGTTLQIQTWILCFPHNQITMVSVMNYVVHTFESKVQIHLDSCRFMPQTKNKYEYLEFWDNLSC